jgi:hypothetical protein
VSRDAWKRDYRRDMLHASGAGFGA